MHTKTAILLICLLFVGACSNNKCRYQAGLGVHDPHLDGPEYDESKNPLVLFRANCRLDGYASVYYEHISQLRVNEKGKGLNHAGYLIDF